MTARRGFTLVELLVAVVIVGLLTSIALPRVESAKRQAKTVAVMSDVRLVRDAAYTYNGETGSWPTASGAGQVPPELVRYLPAGFSFMRDGYILQWTTWTAVPPGGTTAVEFAGVAVHSPSDPALARSVLRTMNGPRYGFGPVTVVIVAGL